MSYDVLYSQIFSPNANRYLRMLFQHWCKAVEEHSLKMAESAPQPRMIRIEWLAHPLIESSTRE